MFHILYSSLILCDFSVAAFEFVNLPLQRFFFRNELLNSSFVSADFHAVLLRDLGDFVFTLAAASFEVIELQSLGLQSVFQYADLIDLRAEVSVELLYFL